MGKPTGRILSVLVPGLARVRRGGWGMGGTILLVWLLLIGVLLIRREDVLVAMSGALDERVASLTLVAGLLSIWWWSWRDLTRGSLSGGGSRWARVTSALEGNRLATAGLALVVLMYVVAILTPLIAPHDPIHQYDLDASRLLGPSPLHPLGTDQYARDVLSRMLYGARISLTIAFVSVGISITIGTTVGAVAGYMGGFVDGVLMRFVDVVIAFPRLVLLIMLMAILETRSIALIIAVLGLTMWPTTARLVRAEVLSLREREFIEAARALGFGRGRILFRHLVPNAFPPVIVAATLGIGDTIALEAALSFLELGVQAPTPSWGTMVADGRTWIADAWWLSTFPGLAIVFTVLSFNLVGDGLRDALDPRLRS